MRYITKLLLIPAAFFLLISLLPAIISATSPELYEVTISTTSRDTKFVVEIARSREELTKGLMYRKSIPDNGGMLFDYGQPVLIAMWMKNTYISLDIIFIGEDNKITKIAKNTVPESLEMIPSEVNARYSLEINAGLSDKLGIKKGDKVSIKPVKY